MPGISQTRESCFQYPNSSGEVEPTRPRKRQAPRRRYSSRGVARAALFTLAPCGDNLSHAFVTSSTLTHGTGEIVGARFSKLVRPPIHRGLCNSREEGNNEPPESAGAALPRSCISRCCCKPDRLWGLGALHSRCRGALRLRCRGLPSLGRVPVTALKFASTEQQGAASGRERDPTHWVACERSRGCTRGMTQLSPCLTRVKGGLAGGGAEVGETIGEGTRGDSESVPKDDSGFNVDVELNVEVRVQGNGGATAAEEEEAEKEKEKLEHVGIDSESDSWLKRRWRYALAKIRKEPLQILTIPVSAACVGWITNKLAVEMIFYPLVWRGIPLRVVEGQPLGLIGWQGIVPAKTGVMSERMVDMVTSQLVDVEEVFRRLSPSRVARLLGPEINSITQGVCNDLLPGTMSWLPGGFASRLPSEAVDELKGLRSSMLAGLTRDLQKQITKVLDLKEMVVSEMLRDRSLMVSLFQRCGKAEFKFLVNSGFFFGFLLGIVQMFVWVLYDKPWTLPAGGAMVGYATNWLAIKLIFEPVDPIKIGPFVLQGLFLKRQNEVAADFAEFFSKNVLTSKKLWAAMLDGSRAGDFREVVTKRVVPFVSKASAVAGANLDPLTVRSLAARAAEKLRDHVYVLHEYTDKTLALKETMTLQMQKMSTRTFEGVLHPVFQEEEFTLIVAGAVLGAIAGFLQMLLSTKGVRQAAKKAAALAAAQAAKAADGVVEAGGEIVGGVAKAPGAAAVVAVAAKREGWTRRAKSISRRCFSAIRRAPPAATRSVTSSLRAAAAALADRHHRRRRRNDIANQAAESVSDAIPGANSSPLTTPSTSSPDALNPPPSDPPSSLEPAPSMSPITTPSPLEPSSQT